MTHVTGVASFPNYSAVLPPPLPPAPPHPLTPPLLSPPLSPRVRHPCVVAQWYTTDTTATRSTQTASVVLAKDAKQLHCNCSRQQYWSSSCARAPCEIVCLLVGCLTSQQHASVSQGRICSILRGATLRWNLRIKLSIRPSHNILTPRQPVPAPTL